MYGDSIGHYQCLARFSRFLSARVQSTESSEFRTPFCTSNAKFRHIGSRYGMCRKLKVQSQSVDSRPSRASSQGPSSRRRLNFVTSALVRDTLPSLGRKICFHNFIGCASFSYSLSSNQLYSEQQSPGVTPAIRLKDLWDLGVIRSVQTDMLRHFVGSWAELLLDFSLHCVLSLNTLIPSSLKFFGCVEGRECMEILHATNFALWDHFALGVHW